MVIQSYKTGCAMEAFFVEMDRPCVLYGSKNLYFKIFIQLANQIWVPKFSKVSFKKISQFQSD